MMYPLEMCRNITTANDYNQQRGLLRYYDPMAKLLCIYLDFAPDMANYFPDIWNTNYRGSQNLKKTLETREKQGFESTAFVITSEQEGTATKYYRIGDKMKS